MFKPRLGLALFLSLAVYLVRPAGVMAQTGIRTPSPTLGTTAAFFDVTAPTMEASDSGAASESAEIATPSAKSVVQEVVEKKPDVTEPKGEVAGKLEQFVLTRDMGNLSVTNFLQHAIRHAVRGGVPANTIVLILLFPLVAALIAAGRHLIGLRGFGIFTPAVLSVAFVATGVVTGIALFVIILLVATVGKNAMRFAKLQYLPRMALLLWLVSLGVLGVLLVSPSLFFLDSAVSLSIFPILILILLAETFIEVQIGKSKKEATELTVETIILALISSLVLSLEVVQRFALAYPELLVLGVAVLDVFTGRYVGLRYTEYRKFKKIIK